MIKIRSEGELWEKFRDRGVKRKWHPTRIESGATKLGIPDVYLCITGQPTWVELKHSNNGEPFELRAAQHRWIQDEIAAGNHNIWILACVNEPGKDPLMLFIKGAHSAYLIRNNSVKDWIDMARYVCFAANMTTSTVEKVLCQRA